MSLYRHGWALLAVLAASLLMTIGAATATAAVPQPPGGPILVVTSGSDPFGTYYTEILRAEGFNDFDVVDVSQLPAGLASHDTVLLAQTSVTDAQVASLTTWVQTGGNLIAMRPDKRLAPLLGLADAGGTLPEANLQIDNSQPPGAGITASPLQFHGTADRYALAGARSVATLSPGGQPAVSVRAVGSGQTAAFTFDLARSIVATRQGNIAWAGQNRDRFAVGDNPDPVVRSNDLFFGGDPSDIQPDWVDLNRVAVPQADEQQRLLANLIVQRSYTPTPRFWYFPRGEKAVLAMTGDDHGSGGTNNVFDTLYNLGPAGCRLPVIDHTLVDNWGCVRATSYVYPDNTPIEPDVAMRWSDYGFEIAAHPLFQADASCVDFSTAAHPNSFDLNATLTNELRIFGEKFPNVPKPTTTRTHCITWSDWDSQPKADAAHGIRLNTDYYYFPAAWTHNQPGMFTGSGMPMRFTATDGSLIDVFQATTYGADDATRINGDTTDPNTSPNNVIPAQGKALLDGALGTNGYYGAFTFQVHSDEVADAPGRDALVADAMNRGVPIVSERQLLTWLDGRDSSKFQNVLFGTDGKLRFSVAPGAGANGLEAMIPVQGRSGTLTTLTRNGQQVAYDTQTIKGVNYAILPDASGDYVASYPAPPAAHPTPGGDSTGGGSTGGGSTGGGAGAGATVAKPSAPSSATKAAKFVTASVASFRPGAKRSFVLTVRLKRAARIVLTIRTPGGKVVRTIRTGRHAAGTVRLRWDGKDSRGRYVKAAKYGFKVTAIGTRYKQTSNGSVRTLTAR
jgi:flagellar hook capping protein FlgD